jgi:SAM-dependent methyltransferase/uncharacterized protein YbaR (Trm112 family)
MKVTEALFGKLVCPRTRQPLLREANIDTAARWMEAKGFSPITRRGMQGPRFETFDEVLLTADGMIAFPVVDQFPALMWPDSIIHNGVQAEVDLSDRTYAEAYSEMAYYNPVGAQRADTLFSSSLYRDFQALAKRADETGPGFPDPLDLWIESAHDSGAQIDVYRYLAPLIDKTFLQLGGDGRHAVKALLAGAGQAVLITPMIGEAEFAYALAESVGVDDRLSCVLGLGEEMPFMDGTFDAIYSPGCLHHMRLDIVLPEIRRVLQIGGRFAAHEPWRAPVYGIGTWLFGKREHGLFNRTQSVFCSPITHQRLASLSDVFPVHIVQNHGPVLRYPMIVLDKLGLRLPTRRMIKIAEADDHIGTVLGLPATWGGSLMVGGEKT